MFTSHQRSNKARENEKQRHKAGIEGGGTEREDTRMQTEVVWTCEENGRERVCQLVIGVQGTRKRGHQESAGWTVFGMMVEWWIWTKLTTEQSGERC